MGTAELWAIISDDVRRIAQNTLKDERFKGRCRHSIWIVVRVFLLCQLEGCSAGLFYERLARDRGLRRRYGLPNRLISYSQYKKRLQTAAFTLALQKLLGYCARRTLQRLGPQETDLVVADLTSIASHPRKDPHGAWGFDSRGFFYGYKLGLIISRHGVILGVTLMKANWTEHKVQGRLLRMAHDTIRMAHGHVQVSYLLADSGFDAERTYRAARRLLHAQALIPPRRLRNPHSKHARISLSRARRKTPLRFKAQALWETPWAKLLARQRSEIERVNSQLKSPLFRIQEIPRRSKGVRRLMRLILGKILIYSFALNVNAARRTPLRGIRGLVA